MKTKCDSIIKFMLNEKTWIMSAVCLLAIVVLLLIAIGIGAFFDDILHWEIIKDLVFPIAAAAAFCVGFCLTIRYTSAIELQTESTQAANELRRRELEQHQNEFKENEEQQHFNRFKTIVKSCDDEGLLTIDALDDLVYEAEQAGTVQQVQKIVTILCSYIKIHSNIKCVRISEFDKSWDGFSRNEKMPSFIIQRILDYLFPIKGDNDSDNDKNNVFFNQRNRLVFDLTLCNLQNMDLSKRVLYNVNFGGSAMHNVKMYKTKCTKCNFWGTYLQGANITGSEFDKQCNFTGAKMAWAIFCDSKFNGVEFIGADLTCAILSRTSLKDCCFKGAVLDGSDIYRQKTKDSQAFEPEFFTAPYDLDISLKFAFIYPATGIVKKEKVIDSCKKTYDKQINRMERLIKYLSLLANEKCATETSLERNTIQENTEVLLGICNKALKYAVIDNSTGLKEENYIEWTDKMKKLMATVTQNNTIQQDEIKS